MFKQDYIMRQIESLSSLLAKLLFNKDSTTYDLPSQEAYEQSDLLYKQLEALLAEGKINEAEDTLFKELDGGNLRYFELALDFYGKLNGFDDQYLAAHNYSREEIEEGLRAIAERFGLPL